METLAPDTLDQTTGGGCAPVYPVVPACPAGPAYRPAFTQPFYYAPMRPQYLMAPGWGWSPYAASGWWPQAQSRWAAYRR